MRTVRILRKRKSDLLMIANWIRFFAVLLRPFARRQREIRLSYMDELRAQQIQARTEAATEQAKVANMRMQKLANDLVIQDMKIEEMKRKLKVYGSADEFAPASRYTSE